MKNIKIGIIGLGYVGLPLAVAFEKKYNTVGYDIDQIRINELQNGFDKTREVSSKNLSELVSLNFTNDLKDIKDCNVYIVTVPTPINEFKSPDLKVLLDASKMIGGLLKKEDVVIYESTVYPGCTEEKCVPVLEKYSKLKFNKDFFCGYSPERINPGDKINTISKIVKVTSGSTKKTANFVNKLYSAIIKAGTHLAPSIKVAEASKAVENAQRDLNISFVNELALIFDRIDIDTLDVIEAASTKWNFLRFKPGLVGGHCIGVDPYYLAQKAESLGYYPEVILSGRRVNDNMGSFVAQKLLKLLIKKEIKIKDSKCLILGFTFKENCPDIRNTRIIDIYSSLKNMSICVDVFDPHANRDEVKKEYGIKTIKKINKKYDSVILAVGHTQFKNLNLKKIVKTKSVVYDLKGIFNREMVDSRL